VKELIQFTVPSNPKYVSTLGRHGPTDGIDPGVGFMLITVYYSRPAAAT
jgi:hypothetical protein